MTDFYHASILIDIRKDRYHPMVFRAAPRPSEDVVVGKPCRHKSIGHHTAGFATMEEAEKHISENDFKPTYIVEAWDGQDVPATICYLPFWEACKAPEVEVKKRDLGPHNMSPKKAIAMRAELKDPFKGMSTGYLLNEWRKFVAGGHAFYIDATEPYLDCWDAPDVETLTYLRMLKDELDRRPHLPNKKDGKAERRAAAKAGK